MIQIRQIIEKTLLALAPISWGLLTWFLGWGPGALLIPNYPLNTIIRATIGFGIFVLCFAKTYNKAIKTVKPSFFGIAFAVPAWWTFIL
jgi:hypothetical protein